MQRVELRVRELLGLFGSEQVGASDRADHQRSAGEQRQPGPSRVSKQVGEVVGCVPWRRDRLEDERPDVDAVAVAETAVGDFEPAASRSEETSRRAPPAQGCRRRSRHASACQR